MEEVYLQQFQHNLSLKNVKELDKFFLNIVSVNELQFNIASELIEHDILTMFDLNNLWRNLKIWQILLMITVFFL